MFIRLEGEDHLLIRTLPGPDGIPGEVVLGSLGSDPELNLFLVAAAGRRQSPELWSDVSDYHLLMALENFKRRWGGFRPALTVVPGKKDSAATTGD